MISRPRIFFSVLFILAALSITVAIVLRFGASVEERKNTPLSERADKPFQTETSASQIDSDGDGLKDWEEALRGTDPKNPDSDGDGTGDGEEISKGRNPLAAGPNDVVTEQATVERKDNEWRGDTFSTAGAGGSAPALSKMTVPFSFVVPPPLTPTILAVYPSRVRKGEIVTVVGRNFTPENNTILLSDGPAERRFDRLTSSDGKTLTFVYNPPDIKTMTEAEIKALPKNTLAQIEEPLKKAGMTIADALKSYREMGVRDETELRTLLESNGHKLEDAYHYFFMGAQNSLGSSMSVAPLLHGLPKAISDLASGSGPKFSFGTIGETALSLLRGITPVANAQTSQKGGGMFVTVLICTCNFDGWMDFMLDYA